MNKTTEVVKENSQVLHELESPARRSFVRGIAGLGAALASSSVFIHGRTGSEPGSCASVTKSCNVPRPGCLGTVYFVQQCRPIFAAYVPPATTAGELQIGVTHTLWILDGIQTVWAVIVHQHGAGIPAAQSGATSAYDLHWQALAKKWNCVLLGPSYCVLNDAIDLTPGGSELWFDPRQGSDKIFLRALDEFAVKSGHAEIATVPWCLWGHSGGGIWANVMSMLHPERVLAAFLRSGTAVMFRPRQEFVQPTVPPAVYEIPTKLVPHLLDNHSGVGNTVLAVNLNHHGAMDIVTSTRFGTFIFWGKPRPKKSTQANTPTKTWRWRVDSYPSL